MEAARRDGEAWREPDNPLDLSPGNPRDVEAEAVDERLRVEQERFSSDRRRKPFALRHPHIQRVTDRANHRWMRLQRFRAIRFIGTFAVLYSQRRAFGFSAEAAFWATFTLPWLFLGAVSAISAIAGPEATAQLQQQILNTTAEVLDQDAVDNYIEPLLDQVVRGSTGLTILGFLVALWSGSRVFASFVEGSVAINGSPKRTYLETRGLALSIYGLGLLCLGILIYTLIRFTDVWKAALGILPGRTSWWVFVLAFLVAVALATSMMWLANPRRRKWWSALPGGFVGLILWLLGSLGLSLYLAWLFRDGSLYGAIATPIAVMLWIFVATLAMFVGITLNATVLLYRDVAKNRLELLQHRHDSALVATGKAIAMAEHPETGDLTDAWNTSTLPAVSAPVKDSRVEEATSPDDRPKPSE